MINEESESVDQNETLQIINEAGSVDNGADRSSLISDPAGNEDDDDDNDDQPMPDLTAD